MCVPTPENKNKQSPNPHPPHHRPSTVLTPIQSLPQSIPRDNSHRQGEQRPQVRRGRAHQARQREAHQWHASRPRHDHPHHHASTAPRGGPRGVQHAQRVTRARRLLRHRRPRRADPRAPRVHRAPAHEPRTLPPSRHRAAQRRLTLRTSGNGKNFARESDREQHRRQLPQSGLLRHRGQVHRRVRAVDPRDVWLRQGARAVHHLHGRDRRHRR